MACFFGLLIQRTMDLISSLALGFSVACTPINLLVALLGCVLGILMGVLPGMGSVAVIALLLPAAYALDSVAALIMLASVCCGAQVGGLIAAIGLRSSGEAVPGARGIDGYQMALQGRAGVALVAASLGAFFAGCVGIVLLTTLAPALAALGVQFGPAEFFALMVVALMGAVVLTTGSLIKAIAMAILGLLLGLVGTDADTSLVRFGFDMPEVSHGVGFVVVAMGVFGYGQLLTTLARPERVRQVSSKTMQELRPTRREWRGMAPAALCGTALGALVGILPGGSTSLASLVSHALEKKSRTKPGDTPIGQGNIRSVAAPEAAAHASAQTAFIPLLALGVPCNAVMALVLGAMTLHNIQPGPELVRSNPELFWGLVASFGVGSVMLLLLNLPLASIWLRLLRVPYRWVFPAVVLIGAMGAYTLQYSSFDIWSVALFGVVGFVFNLLEMDPVPLLMGFTLAPVMEEQLRQALRLSSGDWSVFVSRPLSAGLLAVALVLLFLVLLPASKLRKQQGVFEA